ncbi:hypothetical protein KI387_037592, partial [Taxus chinensis]
ILSELDIYARVGANTPLVLMDAPANVIDGGNLTIRFECRGRNSKSVLEYKRKFKELSKDFELKKKECHEAWMSLEDTNRQLEKLRNELMRKCMHVGSLISLSSGGPSEWAKGPPRQAREGEEIVGFSRNIRVLCRCCPLSSEEVAKVAVSIVDFEAAKDDTTPVVVLVLDGYNVYIFAYGKTRIGNTFTMEGTKENRSVNCKTLEELFRLSNETKGQFKYDISVSVLEVYNEHIRDLLAAPPQPGQTVKKLEIKQVAEGVHHVLGLVEAQVHSMSELFLLLGWIEISLIELVDCLNFEVFNCFVQHFCLHFEALQLGTTPVYIAFLHFMGDDNDAKNFSYSLEVGGSGPKLTCQGIPRSTRDSQRKVRYNHDGLIIQRNMALFFSGSDRRIEA